MNERTIHKQVCRYIKLQYPKAIFNSDLSGMNTHKIQAAQNKALRSSRAFPDIVIYEPKNGFHGLFIELKADGVRLWKKKGDWASEHLREQADMIHELRKRGYYASFAIGFDEAKRVIDFYLTPSSKQSLS